MKENRLVVFTVLLLLSAAVFQLPAQQNEARRKSSVDISSKAETSDAERVKSYRKAAEQNDAIAQFNLAFAYAVGRGLAKDDAEAVKWYRRAAEQDFAQAQINLALSYALRQGVAKDYVESYKWTLLAASQGEKEAKETVTILESNMSPEQIAEGQKVARDFKPRLAPSAEADTSSAGIAQPRAQSSGTGFFITEDGYLITDEHVAGSEAQVRLVTREGLI
jgi:TPR repeat protein